ncbi:MAG: Imm49 family immunity protein [Chitinophagaceae bacterium]
MDNTASKEERLIAVYESIINNLPRLKLSLQEGRTNERFISMTFHGHFECLGLKAFFIDNNLPLARLHFYNAALMDVLLTNKYDEKILDSGILRLGYALLSNSRELVEQYANLKHSNLEYAINKGSAAPVYIMQCLINENWSEFERAMTVMNTRIAPKFNMHLDAAFYTALAEKNKEKMEEILNQFVSPKVHKARNKHHVLIGEFISQPAIAYAKLAWWKGIEVEVNSPLVPKELLPITPLPEYHPIDLLSGKASY